jgi:CelD/BcsL family acetyltransferase involved in cellulose biosynthesis
MIFTLNPLEDPRWEEFVRAHPRASIYHTRGWLEALRRTYGYEPVVFTTSPAAADLKNCVVFCRISSWLTGCRMVSLPFADHCEPLVENADDGKEIFSFLVHTLAKERWKYVEIRPLSSDLLSEDSAEKSSSFFSHVMDLSPSLDVLFQGFHKDSTQRAIRRAEREGLSYEAGRSEALLRNFFSLLLKTRRRHKLPPQPIDWFRNLIACLGNRLSIRLVSKNGQPVASILTLSHQGTVVYKYGCSDSNFHSLGGTPLLLWRTIQEAKAQGLREFDLGRSEIDNAGLVTFKDRWRAQRTTLTYVRLSTQRSPNVTDGYGMQIAKRVFGCMPDGLLVATGRMLYRHIG